MHPTVIAFDDVAVRAVVGCEPYDRTAFEAVRKFQDVPYRCAAKPVEALILVADDAEIAGRFGELEQQLLLNIVRVLVLVDQHVTHFARERILMLWVDEETVDDTLEMREVGAVIFRREQLRKPGTLLRCVAGTDH